MVWQIKYSENIAKTLKKITPSDRQRIKRYIENRLITAENPTILGKPLQGKLGDYIRWRVGDYRIIGQIDEQQITILIIKIGHRKQVYQHF